jgi:hypothetical protein
MAGESFPAVLLVASKPSIFGKIKCVEKVNQPHYGNTDHYPTKQDFRRIGVRAGRSRVLAGKGITIVAGLYRLAKLLEHS